jgi:hypothetical protein
VAWVVAWVVAAMLARGERVGDLIREINSAEDWAYSLVTEVFRELNVIPVG